VLSGSYDEAPGTLVKIIVGDFLILSGVLKPRREVSFIPIVGTLDK